MSATKRPRATPVSPGRAGRGERPGRGTAACEAASSASHPPVATVDGLAVHHDQGKPRYDLIPPEVMDALADHYRRGAAKYEDRNWERGMAWCRMFGSIMRHSWAWMRGQDFDEETGTHHMVCVMWNAAALFTYHARQSGLDDRPATAQSQRTWVINP